MENRFVQVHYEELPKTAKIKGYYASNIVRTVEIIKDIHTGVLYYHASSGNSAPTVAPLLDIDGKPLIDKSE